MSKASKSHSEFKKKLENLTQKTASKDSDVMMRKLREQALNRDNPDIVKKYLIEVMNQGVNNFYLIESQNRYEPSVGLISKNFKSVMFIALNKTDNKFLRHY